MMIDLLETEKSLLKGHIRPGGRAADFTMGNGHDTCWLSNMVGPEGFVYAFDIQQQALDHTAALLREKGNPDNVLLILDSHANADRYIKEPICAGMFNLGWLPGGDKPVTTLLPSTLKALECAIRLLEPDGAILLAVYPGHAEGRKEGEAVAEYLSSLDRRSLCCSRFQIVNSPDSPYFFLIEKKA